MTTINEANMGPDIEPSMREQAMDFLDRFFNRSPETIEDDYYKLAAANSLLADRQTPEDYRIKAVSERESILKILYPSETIISTINREFSTELDERRLVLDVVASELSTEPDKANLFRAVTRAHIDIGITISAGVTYENSDQLGHGGIRPLGRAIDQASSGGDGTSKRMRDIALRDYDGL